VPDGCHGGCQAQRLCVRRFRPSPSSERSGPEECKTCWAWHRLGADYDPYSPNDRETASMAAHPSLMFSLSALIGKEENLTMTTLDDGLIHMC